MRKITNEELGRPTPAQFAAMATLPVAVVLDNVRSSQNVGAFFRTGDAFAVERIALCGITAAPPNRDIHKTALGAELTVAWSYHASTEECVGELRRAGYEIWAVEQVEGAVALDAFRPEPGRSSTAATARWRFPRREPNTRSTSRWRAGWCCGTSSRTCAPPINKKER